MTTKSEAPPAAAEDPAAAKAKAEAEAAEAQAKEARAKLKLIKVTATRKARIDAPHAAWSLNEGVNAFEGDVPEPVAIAYAKLIVDGVATVEWVDGIGKAHTWVAPKLPVDDGKQR